MTPETDGGAACGSGPQVRVGFRVAGMAAVIVALHVAGWGMFVLAVLPHHVRYQALGAGLGAALAAYGLGARHAFDADHISAIDNVTRKLTGEGRRPVATGFFFALGHSTLVVAAGVGLTVAARLVLRTVVNPQSGFERFGGLIGTGVSGSFLYLIAAMNLIVLVGIVKLLRSLRHGELDHDALERRLQERGLMYRFFGRLMGAIRHSWQMYPVGVLFALGFDTATEVVVLGATASVATAGLAWYTVLALPVLFSAGVTLFDTLDGCFMQVAYGWAFANPARKLYYNLVVTGLSIVAAFVVGSIELLGLISKELGWHGGLWRAIDGISINEVGLVIVVVLAAVFVVAAAVWRLSAIRARVERAADA